MSLSLDMSTATEIVIAALVHEGMSRSDARSTATDNAAGVQDALTNGRNGKLGRSAIIDFAKSLT